MADKKDLSKVISSLTDAISILNSYAADEDDDIIEKENDMIEIVDEEPVEETTEESSEEVVDSDESEEESTEKEEVEEGLFDTLKDRFSRKDKKSSDRTSSYSSSSLTPVRGEKIQSAARAWLSPYASARMTEDQCDALYDKFRAFIKREFPSNKYYCYDKLTIGPSGSAIDNPTIMDVADGTFYRMIRAKREKLDNEDNCDEGNCDEGLLGAGLALGAGALAAGTTAGVAGAVTNKLLNSYEKDSEDKEEVNEAATDEDDTLGAEIAKYQEWVDYDMEHYGKISARTSSFIRKAGLEIVEDKYGDYEVIAKDDFHESVGALAGAAGTALVTGAAGAAGGLAVNQIAKKIQKDKKVTEAADEEAEKGESESSDEDNASAENENSATTGEMAKETASAIAAYFKEHSDSDNKKVQVASAIIDAVPPELIDKVIEKTKEIAGNIKITPEMKDQFAKKNIDATDFDRVGDMIDGFTENDTSAKSAKALILTILGIIAIIEPTPVLEIVTAILAFIPPKILLKILIISGLSGVGGAVLGAPGSLAGIIIPIIYWYRKEHRSDKANWKPEELKESMLVDSDDEEVDEGLLGAGLAAAGLGAAAGIGAGVTGAVTNKLLSSRESDKNKPQVNEAEEEAEEVEEEESEEELDESVLGTIGTILNPLTPVKVVGKAVGGIGNAIGSIGEGKEECDDDECTEEECNEARCNEADECDEGLLGAGLAAAGLGAAAGIGAGVAGGITKKILSSDDAEGEETEEEKEERQEKALNEAKISDFEDMFNFYLSPRIAEDVFYRDAYILIEPTEEAFDIGVEVIYVDADQMIYLYNEATEKDMYEHYVENDIDTDSEIRKILQSYSAAELDDIASVRVVKGKYYR